MIVAGHQPNYLPNLSFFNKMAQADTFVVFTHAQFSKRDGWVRRHKIQSANKDLWLTVPVHASTNDDELIKDVMIDNSHKWRFSHRETIRQSYAKTKEKEALAKIISVYEQKYERLVDLNLALILAIKNILGIDTTVVLDEEVCGEKQDLLINIAKKYGANTYLSGMGGKEYMTEEYFQSLKDNGVTNTFVDNSLTAEYPFTSIHYILTAGLDWARSITFDPAGKGNLHTPPLPLVTA